MFFIGLVIGLFAGAFIGVAFMSLFAAHTADDKETKDNSSGE